MASHSDNSSKGSMGCGCFLIILMAGVWGTCTFFFPKLPDYDEAMTSGAIVPGEVLRVEDVENITINDRHPRKVIFSYGDGLEGSMMMAMKESAKPGQTLQVRVLGEHAYPEGIRPFRLPGWLNIALIVGAVIGALIITAGLLRLLLIGGVLFAAGRKQTKKSQNHKQTPPPPPPPAPPAS